MFQRRGTCARPSVAKRTSPCWRRSALLETSPPRVSRLVTISNSGRCLGRSTPKRAAKVSGSRFYYLTGGRCTPRDRAAQPCDGPGDAQRLRAGDSPRARVAARDGRHGVPRPGAENVYRIESDDMYLVGTAEVPLAGLHSDEIIPSASLPLRYAGLVVVLPPRSRFLRQRHTRHHPGSHQFDKVGDVRFLRSG